MSFNYSPRIITDGLVLYLDAGNTRSYPTTGTTWNDISRGGYNVTLVNGPTFNSGNGGSIVFDGSNDYVIRSSFINVGSNFSVFVWLYPGNINIRNGIIGNSYPYTARQGFFLSTATNYNGITNSFFLTIGSDIAYQIASNNSITPYLWNYIGGTVSNGGGTIKLYKNGNETSYFGGSQSSGTITYSTNVFLVGGRITTSNEVFNGRIAMVQMYNKVLSLSEIEQNFNATKSRFGL